MDFINLNYLLYYLLVINILSSFILIIDKINSLKSGNRIRESNLLLLSLLGGGFLGIITMFMIRHKIKKKWFIFRYIIFTLFSTLVIIYII